MATLTRRFSLRFPRANGLEQRLQEKLTSSWHSEEFVYLLAFNFKSSWQNFSQLKSQICEWPIAHHCWLLSLYSRIVSNSQLRGWGYTQLSDDMGRFGTKVIMKLVQYICNMWDASRIVIIRVTHLLILRVVEFLCSVQPSYLPKNTMNFESVAWDPRVQRFVSASHETIVLWGPLTDQGYSGARSSALLVMDVACCNRFGPAWMQDGIFGLLHGISEQTIQHVA